MCFDPLPTCMVSQRRRLAFVYREGQEQVRLHFAEARALCDESTASEFTKPTLKTNIRKRQEHITRRLDPLSRSFGMPKCRAASASEPPPVDEEPDAISPGRQDHMRWTAADLGSCQLLCTASRHCGRSPRFAVVGLLWSVPMIGFAMSAMLDVRDGDGFGRNA
jgi:hypothetical protein